MQSNPFPYFITGRIAKYPLQRRRMERCNRLLSQPLPTSPRTKALPIPTVPKTQPAWLESPNYVGSDKRAEYLMQGRRMERCNRLLLHEPLPSVSLPCMNTLLLQTSSSSLGAFYLPDTNHVAFGNGWTSRILGLWMGMLDWREVYTVEPIGHTAQHASVRKLVC